MLRKFRVNVNGKAYLVEVEELGNTQGNQPREAKEEAMPAPAAIEAKEVAQPKEQPLAAKGITLEAPMPGKILSVLVKVGDQVSFEQPLVILEAMKMENELVAPQAGTVTHIYVQEGSAIDVGKPIITID